MTLEQWFSAFLLLQPSNTVPPALVTLNHKIIFTATVTVVLLLLWILMQNVFPDGLKRPLRKGFWTHKGVETHSLRATGGGGAVGGSRGRKCGHAGRGGGLGKPDAVQEEEGLMAVT